MAKKKATAYVEKVKIKNKLKDDGFRLTKGYEVKKRAAKPKKSK